jgi:asparagine synthase (glutamine-hydrolysing)
MCGIAGYFNLNLSQELALEMLHNMNNALIHRGPDDAGCYQDEWVGLAMRRLSIIDLRSGHQPIANEDGSKHIVYNGEVYNYAELRSTLEKQGHIFATASDTEVILHQYEQSGPGCLSHLNGMFALAIWDKAARTLFLARDRLGIKPLYYYWDGQSLLFASEIKAILAAKYVQPAINPQAIWDYLTFRYVPQPQTIWQNIYKLRPGHTLTISSQQPEPVMRRYWDIPYGDDGVAKDETEYIREFEHLFLDAVRLRLIADVPVGILLSGGLDSSAVAAAIAEVHNARLNSFSVAFENAPDTDELPYARQMAAHVKTDHHEIVIGPQEFCDFLPEFVHYTDEPLADLASIPLYYVSRLARQTVKVVLSGEGSDEVLAGYSFDAVQRNWDKVRLFQRIPAWLRQGIAQPVACLLHRRLCDFFQKSNTPLAQRLWRYPSNMTKYLDSNQKRVLWQGPDSWPDSMAIIQQEASRAGSAEPLHQMLYICCQSWLVEDLLMKADKMTMANSLELRVPFLDYRLVEWAAQTPAWVKIGPKGNYQTKWILRRFAQARLPLEIINRPKQGFPVPVYGWLANRLKPWATDLLTAPNAKLFTWLKPEQVRRQLILGTDEQAPVLDQHYLWNLLILELWLQAWQ